MQLKFTSCLDDNLIRGAKSFAVEADVSMSKPVADFLPFADHRNIDGTEDRCPDTRRVDPFRNASPSTEEGIFHRLGIYFPLLGDVIPIILSYTAICKNMSALSGAYDDD